MPIPARDYFDFLFNGGRGLRTDQIDGANVESVTEDEATGVVTLVATLANGTSMTHQLDGSLLINAAPDANPQPTADNSNFEDRRLWWDGVILKRVTRIPGHGIIVNWPDYASSSYRGEFRNNPPNFQNNQFYYHLGARNFVYRINGRNIGGTPSGWRGHVANEAAAEALVTANNQIFEWNDNVHISANYQAPVNAEFFWEPVLVATYELRQSEAEDTDSEVQGTVSGERLSQAVGSYGPEEFQDAIRDGLVVVQDRNPVEADYENNRIFYDGIVVRKVIRRPVPGHDRIVSFREDNLQISQYGTGIYVDRQAADSVPGTPNVGDRFFNRNLNHWEIWEAGNYWNTSQFIAAPQDSQGSLWIGEFGNKDLADAHVGRLGQIASYPDDSGIYVLHRVDSITAQTEDGFRYELDPIFNAHALANAELDNANSDVQGTVSGRGLERAVVEYSPFTDVEQDILEDLSRQTFPYPTDDWQIRQTYVARDFFTDRYATFLSLGWDADNRLRALSADGHVGRLGRQDIGRIYDGSDRLRGGLISGVHWLYLRDDGVGSSIVRAPVGGGDSDPEFSIVLRYFSIFADPDSGTLLGILRRISADEMEVGLLSYDAVAGTITAEDTITIDRAHLNDTLGADYAPLPDIHRESATGVYQNVAGAILEGDTLYLILTDIAKTDGHTTSVLVGFTLAGTPNNRTLTVLSENAVDELPVSNELTSGILPLEADELFIARDTAVYRLSPMAETPIVEDMEVDWGDVENRPNRPTAQEIIGGIDTDEAVPSVSDVRAIANAHSQRTLSNQNPQSVADTPASGVEGEVARRDHVHDLPLDSTLEFDPVSGDLGVNVHDVITHLQESIRYFTNSIDHPADPGGHSAGQMFRTGPFPTTISRVQAQIDVLVGHPSYAARIYHVDSDREVLEFLGESAHFVPLSNNPHSYDFTVDDDIGIPIPESSFIVVLFHAVGGVLIPLRTGDEASDSPGKSYQDANRDFNMVNSVVYEHVHPSIGDSTVSHGGADHIRGNIKIFYDIAYDHGSLLGGTKANTDLQNIDEDLTEAEQAAIRDRIGATDEIGLVVASSVTQPNSLIQGGLPRFRLNVNTPGDGEPLDGQVLKFRFDGPFVNMVGAATYSFATFTVSLFLNNTDLFSADREGAFVYPDGRSVRGDDFPTDRDAYALKTPDGYVWLTSGDLLSGIENTVDANDIDNIDEVAVIRHTVGRDPTRRLPIDDLRTVMTRDLNFANRNLDNIILDDKSTRDGHRVAIGVSPPSKDFPFGSGELLGNVFAGLNNISGATKFRNSLYGVDSAFTPTRLVRIDTDDSQNDDDPYGSLGDLDPGIDDPQSLVVVGEQLYIVNGNATNAGLWRINPDDPGDISGVYGRVGGFPAGLTNPRGSFPANGDLYVIQGNMGPDFDELWRINELNPESTANPLGLQYSLPANITGSPTSGVWHDGYAYIVTGSGRQLFRIDPDNLSHGQPTTSDNRFGLVGTLPIPATETVTAVASLGGVLYVFTGAQIWAKSVGNIEFDLIKANIDLQNIRDNLTAAEQQVVRTRINAAEQGATPAQGSTVVGNHSQVILWQYVSLGQVPPDPPDAYNETDETFLADTGSWFTSEASALAARANAADALWVAYGGTDLDSSGNPVNRDWTVQAATQIRYSPDRNNATTSEETDSRYIQFRLPSGDWSPWIAIAADNDGWVNVWADVEAFAPGSLSLYRNFPLAASFDAEHFSEIRFRAIAYGNRDDDGNIDRIGAQDDHTVSRKDGGRWTEITNPMNNNLNSGSFKLRLDDIVGLDVVQSGSIFIDTEFDDNILAITNYPERRQSFSVQLIANGVDDLHTLVDLRVGHWQGTWAKVILAIDFK